MTNAAFGEVMCLIAGIAVIFVDVDGFFKNYLKNTPLTKEMIYPAIPFLVYFFIGMVSTPAFTPSLEGKNYWIVQSLPIKKKTLYQGKMLFNMILTVPFGLFTTLMLCISSKASLLSTVLYMVLIFCLCAFSTAWGCVCGVKHMRFDWENEIEVIKQGTGITAYILPNIFVTIAMVPLSVFLGMRFNRDIVAVIMIAVVSLLAVLSYMKVMSMAKKQTV